MEHGFRPHDRDRTTESMEGSLRGFGPLWRGVGLQDERGFTVTRLTIGVLNDLQMARNLKGGLSVLYQGRLANNGPFRECFSPAHETRSERGDRARRECRIAKRTTGKRTGCKF